MPNIRLLHNANNARNFIVSRPYTEQTTKLSWPNLANFLIRQRFAAVSIILKQSQYTYGEMVPEIYISLFGRRIGSRVNQLSQ